ncbi:MAG TPA: hypothetical protein VIM59_02835 [Cellvibrio sp.]
MKLLRYLTMKMFLLLLLIQSSAANALLLFTYTSNPLPWQASYNEGYPDDLGSDIAPSFTLSFTAPEQDWTLKKSTNFFMENPSITLTDNYILEQIDIRSLSYGRVTLDQNGAVSGWNLILFLTEYIAPGATPFEKYLYQLASERIDIVSRYGSNTCNCDSFKKHFYPLYYFPRSNTYMRLAQQDRFYGDSNSPGQWTISHINVSEPPALGLMVIGLGSLFFYRRRMNARQRKSIT